MVWKKGTFMGHKLFLLSCLLLLAACGKGPASPKVQVAALPAWPVVRQGDNNRNVVTLQYLLRAKGQAVDVDGDFGPKTATAVRNIQRASGLVVDGVVGANTWAKLIPLVSSTASNDAIRAVQDQLKNRYGYKSDINGSFTTATEGFIKSFQKSRALPETGKVDTQTWRALVGAGLGAGTNAEVAKRLLQNTRVSFSKCSPVIDADLQTCPTDGADARNNMVDTSAGLEAKRSCGGRAPCGFKALSPRMLRILEAVSQTYSVRVSSLVGGEHSPTSYHYEGTTFDVYAINGKFVSINNGLFRSLKQMCLDYGAVEVLGPGDAGHSGHVHCAWEQ
jgi:zinc D-Ala-D-Ala carboxypeptidase